jgi:hypothetical protein
MIPVRGRYEITTIIRKLQPVRKIEVPVYDFVMH